MASLTFVLLRIFLTASIARSLLMNSSSIQVEGEVNEGFKRMLDT